MWACVECGHIEHKWVGSCPTCGAWNTFSEEIAIDPKEEARFGIPKVTARPRRVTEIEEKEAERMSTNYAELDALLGKGLVKGSLTLVGGEPGIGKSTLMLQLAHRFAEQGLVVLYICGEESAEQTTMRARRLNALNPNIYLLSETVFANIKREIDGINPDVLILDSVQIVYKAEIPSAPGSVTQVREVAMEAMQIAKGKGITTFLIGHVTKSGELAGPRVLEHIVDTVLEFEGDRSHGYRMVRSQKNRFGPTDEVALFEMKETGLKEVVNPSEVFLQERMRGVSGSCVIPTVEGTRSMLVELQALVARSTYATAARRTTGVDAKRLTLLLAVLEKRMGYQLQTYDVFVSIAGGLKIYEPAVDLAAVIAITSSFLNKPIPDNVVVMGEVGLNGEVRSIPRAETRIKEAINMGFSRCILAKKNLRGIGKEIQSKITLHGIDRVEEAVELLF